MAQFRCIFASNFDHRSSDSIAASSLRFSMERPFSELQAATDHRQHGLKMLSRNMFKTGFVSQDVAALMELMETTVLICQHTHQHIEQSFTRLAKFIESDTSPQYQILKAESLLCRYNQLDTLK